MKAPPGVNLTKGNLHKHNQAIMGYIHGDDTRKTILAADGVLRGEMMVVGDVRELRDGAERFWAAKFRVRGLGH